jgi:hypothetical protein
VQALRGIVDDQADGINNALVSMCEAIAKDISPFDLQRSDPVFMLCMSDSFSIFSPLVKPHVFVALLFSMDTSRAASCSSF